jgi:hypothetical protein
MGIKQHVDEEAALQVRGIAADLAAAKAELPFEMVVVEIGMTKPQSTPNKRISPGLIKSRSPRSRPPLPVEGSV